jgi:DNA repair protein RecO (recombination protein O)
MGYTEAMDYNLTAIVVGRWHAGENDIRAVLYTLEHGRVSVIVRGTHKPVSSLRPATEPLNYGEALVVRRRGTDLLTEWLPLKSFPGIRPDLRKIALAGYFARMASSLTADFEPEPRLYFMLRNALFLLPKIRDCGIMKSVYEWGFLEISGLSMELTRCVVCGGRLRGGRAPVLSVPQGGIICGDCAGADASGGQKISLRLDTLETGKKISELFSGISGEPIEDGAGIGGIIHGLDAVSADAGRRGTADELQFALSRFLQFHIHEHINSWHLKL